MADDTRAAEILAGLGGAGNVVEVEGCITRLRTEVTDPSKVDQAALRKLSHGVVVSGTAVQVVVGPEADMIADDIEDLL
ncbi:PTS system N-acetylglucosamine-specific IIB component (Glc family) [Pseudonocardia sediminis]|uniref:PTS system N-acetylglucosamine-specific IIB component (Glc family) n=1 Tax=Pseudonocardia sediminis TaxID=1397368 RepID=A0A4Q7URA3_PSEST|nr:PTS glucose/sucrose transporter subunit IIB [Pseudonocardia sediminis]RZT83504.1 PTS system N-acetylglucosamine-specific IIB component (Glc family) [Pseudonocardia sediminis]